MMIFIEFLNILDFIQGGQSIATSFKNNIITVLGNTII